MKKALLIVTFFIISLTTFAQDVDFELSYILPSPRAATSSTNDGESIYLVNGFSDTSFYTSEVYKREPNSGWNVLTDQTIPKNYASVAFVNGKLYVFNGKTTSGYNNQMEVVDATTGTITLSTINPSPARAGGVSTWNGEIYSFGGSTASGVFSNNVYKFNPVTETWTFVTNMPIAAETKGEIVNGKLYIFGGYGTSGSLNSIHIYDITADSWSTAADLPINLSATATAIIGDAIWLAGDYVNQTFLARFDTTTLTLSQKNSNMMARRHASAEGIGEKLYVMGGNTTSDLSSTISSFQMTDLAEHTVPVAERNALMAIYNATNGDNWTNNTNWDSAYAESLWHGVTVEEVNGTYHVTKIYFYNNNLNGYLPAEIGNLTELKEINLISNNQLTGAIPSEIGSLLELEVLFLWKCNFTGNIPTEIGNCTNIRVLHIIENQLTGNIPTSFSNLTAMVSFRINGNYFSGDIPDIFSDWVNLVYFSIGNVQGPAGAHNDFTGSLDLSNNNALALCWIDNTLISSLNIQNGNNINFYYDSYFRANNNPNLTCIFVDNAAYSNANWTYKDATATFLETQAECDALFTSIPDNNFEQALIDLNIDHVIDGKVRTSNISNITSLDVGLKNISDLTGIEDFTNLITLKCWENNLATLNITQNILLETLLCSQNQLNTLNVSNNHNLVVLNCSTNYISDLNLSQNPNLEILYAWETQISNLDISSNPNIYAFNCGYNNNLTNIDLRNGYNINLSNPTFTNNPNLTCVFVDDAAWSTTNWTNIDATATFVETETECNALDVNDETFKQNIEISPNPTSSLIYINTNNNIEIKKITIYNTLGQKLIESLAVNKMDISKLTNGIYYVNFESIEGFKASYKVIKE